MKELAKRWRGGAAIVVLAVGWMAWGGVGPWPARAADENDVVDTEAEVAILRLPERHRQFLADTAILMSDEEQEVFRGLDEDYRRDLFMRRFWRVRDPFPETGRNEWRDAWEQRLVVARERFESLETERPEMLLALGVPAQMTPLHCSDMLRPIEVWAYPQGSDRIAGAFTLVFVGTQPGGRGVHRLWQPSQGLQALTVLGAANAFDERRLAREIGEACIRSGDILSALAQALELAGKGPRDLLPAPPGAEWVETFRARSTSVAADAEPLDAALTLGFPGRHQSRTVVQGVVSVPRAAAEPVARGAYRGYSFLLDGEVLRGGELFDQFRYRFDLPENGLGDEIPLVIQRYLRPGAYQVIVKVEDLVSHRVFREAHDLEVPRVTVERTLAVTAGGDVVPASVKAEVAASEVADVERQDAWRGSPVDNRLAEANATIATGDHSIQILRIPSKLTVGKLRVEARTRGDGIARVAFDLNGRPLMRKSRPPFSVEIDLGDRPRIHTIRARALDGSGAVLAVDEVQVNTGPHRFGIRLIEPQRGRQYLDSVRVHAEVQVPESERLEKVELFLNETLLATLYQPPFEQPILLPENLGLAWVRAVAHLTDGNRAEDTVFINAPDFTDEMKVQMVELFTSVTDRKKTFVEGLTAEDFQVFEDGQLQSVVRFETVRDLPIHAGIVLDTSLSMLEELGSVEKAAYRFLETVITARDRAAVITFSDAPTLAVRFTNDPAVLAGGLANLVAEGETALYDTLLFSLHYFSGLRGKRVLIVLTDGEDSASRYRYADVVEFARHTGVSLYIIGLALPSRATEIRAAMRRLTQETGGGFFEIQNVAALERIYRIIEQEVRSQYLIAYQSPNTSDEGFRRVEVEMARRGLEAKTISGYFP